MLHEGHRSRMIEKLQKGDSFSEHELLEILLFNAIPRKNTNEIAHRLLDHFHSIRSIFSASEQELAEVEGIGNSTAAYLKVIGLFYDKYVPEMDEIEFFERGSAELKKKLLQKYQRLTSEVIDVYFLDKRNNVINVKSFTNYCASQVQIDPRDFAKLVSDAKAYAIVIVHNHPMASCAPSFNDDQFTKQCMILCSMTNIVFWDHYIVGNTGVYSYYNSLHLSEIQKKYNIRSLLNED